MAVRKLEVQFIGDDVSAGRTFSRIGDEADRTESKMSKWSTRIAGAIGAAFAVDAIVDWGATLINAAEESQQVTRQTEAVITSMGGASKVSAKEVADLAEAISLKTGLDDEMIQSGENVLLTFGNIRNEVGESNDIFTRATQAATDMSVAMGTDLQSSVVQVGKALNDPIAGMSALTRVGVQFSDDQKAVIEQLVATGDTLGAQKVILEELERQFGGSAEAQATASDKLRVAWDNVQEQLGTVLLPIFEKIATWLAETLPGAIDTSIQWLKAHEDQVKLAAIAIGVVLVGALAAYTAQAIIAAGATIIAMLPILLLIGLVAVLAFGLFYAYQNWGWFRAGVQGGIDILFEVIDAIRKTIEWIDKLSDKLRIINIGGGGALGALQGTTAAAQALAGGGPSKGAGRNIPRAAKGGLVFEPTVLLAGESGPEAIVPLDRGFGMGGPTYNFYFEVGTLVGRNAALELVDMVNTGLAQGKRLQAQGRGL